MDNSQTALHFPLLSHKPVIVSFNGGSLSSDGGLLLLAHLDQQLDLTQRVAACIHDARLKERVHHSMLDLIRQRVYQLAAGYEDANDATTLRHDPAFKLALGRAPTTGSDLASQPTLSRLENTVAEADAEAVNAVLLDTFCQTPRTTPREIVLDLDTSAHPTHGQQSFAIFNDHYRTTCYLPLFLFARVCGEAEEWLVGAELLDHHGQDEAALVLSVERVVTHLRQRWPTVRVIVRADSWFSLPGLYDWCDANEVGYAIAIAANSVLKQKSQPLREAVEKKARKAGEVCWYGKVRYQAGSWKKEREVIVKATAQAGGSHVRYVVVSRVKGSAKRQYEFYGERGDSENRIKELKEGIGTGRMSCSEYASNKVRLMLCSVAYVLMQQMRRVAGGTEVGRKQVNGLRLMVIKIGARIKESQRRVVVEMSSSCPSQEVWREIARRLSIAPA